MVGDIMKHATVAAFWFTCLAIFSAGLFVNRSWLFAETARLETWKVPVVWLSELTALVLFVRFGFCWFFQRVTSRSSKRITAAFVLGTILDLTLSGMSVLDEDAAYARSVVAPANVTNASHWMQSNQDTRYTFTYEFRDDQGNLHKGWCSDVRDGIPAEVKRAICNGKIPAPLQIKYDPRWPARSWLAGVQYTHDNRLFVFSLFTILLGCIAAATLVAFRPTLTWLPTTDVAPFLGATWVLCTAAAFQGGW